MLLNLDKSKNFVVWQRVQNIEMQRKHCGKKRMMESALHWLYTIRAMLWPKEVYNSLPKKFSDWYK